MFVKFASLFLNAARQITPTVVQNQIHTGCQTLLTKSLCSSETSVTAGGSWALISIRNKMRYHFPYPKEHVRITRHGWAKRMSSTSGRRILMRRILKGRHVLSH